MDKKINEPTTMNELISSDLNNDLRNDELEEMAEPSKAEQTFTQQPSPEWIRIIDNGMEFSVGSCTLNVKVLAEILLWLRLNWTNKENQNGAMSYHG